MKELCVVIGLVVVDFVFGICCLMIWWWTLLRRNWIGISRVWNLGEIWEFGFGEVIGEMRCEGLKGFI